MRISDWSSDVCSSDLPIPALRLRRCNYCRRVPCPGFAGIARCRWPRDQEADKAQRTGVDFHHSAAWRKACCRPSAFPGTSLPDQQRRTNRSEEHTSELQSLMRISYAVFCLKKKNRYKQRKTKKIRTHIHNNVQCYIKNMMEKEDLQ